MGKMKGPKKMEFTINVTNVEMEPLFAYHPQEIYDLHTNYMV